MEIKDNAIADLTKVQCALVNGKDLIYMILVIMDYLLDVMGSHWGILSTGMI